MLLGNQGVGKNVVVDRALELLRAERECATRAALSLSRFLSLARVSRETKKRF